MFCRVSIYSSLIVIDTPFSFLYSSHRALLAKRIGIQLRFSGPHFGSTLSAHRSQGTYPFAGILQSHTRHFPAVVHSLHMRARYRIISTTCSGTIQANNVPNTKDAHLMGFIMSRLLTAIAQKLYVCDSCLQL